jgi:hypothetical protein
MSSGEPPEIIHQDSNNQDVADQPVNNAIDLSETSPEDVVYEPDELQKRVIYKDNMVKSTGVHDITHRYSLREKRPEWRDRYSEHYTAAVVLTNLSIPKAIKLYGIEALASVMKEMLQLHDKGVWIPTKYENIGDKTKIIRSLLFLKRKRDGSLKARLVADGRMQDRSASQDNSSPTVSTESLFLLSTVFASERRYVVTIDIEGAYLHGVMTSEVYMEISGQCLDILIYSYSDIYILNMCIETGCM